MVTNGNRVGCSLSGVWLEEDAWWKKTDLEWEYYKLREWGEPLQPRLSNVENARIKKNTPIEIWNRMVEWTAIQLARKWEMEAELILAPICTQLNKNLA
jgi:hypothetical protein